MRNKSITAATVSIAIIGTSFLWQENTPSKYQQRQLDATNNNVAGQNDAVRYMNSVRANQITGNIDPALVLAAREKSIMLNAQKSAGFNWTELGPDNVGGRTRSILIEKNTGKLFAGGVSGGLWYSTDEGANWSKVSDQLENLAVTSITQAPNGYIYFGTGEGLYLSEGKGRGGIVGGGIFRSTDGGATFSLLTNTKPAANASDAEWAFVNKLAASPSGRLFAATNKGLRISDDNGDNWSDPVSVTGFSADVDVASDGTVITTIANECYVSANGNAGSFGKITSNLPAAVNLSRIEFAIAPSDPNYMYASCADTKGKLAGVYQSIDKGQNWSLIGAGGSTTFNPFKSDLYANTFNGDYDNALSVYPNNKGKIILGGVVMWTWTQSATIGVGQWEKIGSTLQSPFNPYYVHANVHVFTFNASNPSIFYIGTDGGIFRTKNSGDNFTPVNRGFNVTQFYSVAFESNGSNGSGVTGGSCGNGSLYISGKYTPQPMYAAELYSGDGGDVEISLLNPDVYFVSSAYGNVVRSKDKEVFSSFYSSNVTVSPTAKEASFITPTALYESYNDLNSKDSVTFIADRTYYNGETVTLTSKTNKLKFNHTFADTVYSGDTIKIQDVIQSKFAVGFHGYNNVNGSRGVWLTKEPLNFIDVPYWVKVAGGKSAPDSLTPGTVEALVFSNDGDILYCGLETGEVYRISNLNAITDTSNGNSDSPKSVVICHKIASFGGRFVTGLAVDPNDANKLIVTLGNYGNSTYIYKCDSAKTCGSSSGTDKFASVQGNLPAMPVYGAVIIKSAPNTVMLATENGVFYTEDITNPTWADAGMPKVPCYAIRQQTWPAWNVNNSGMVYVATHGRGIWKSDKYYVPLSVKESRINMANSASIVVFPNPVAEYAKVSFRISKASAVNINVYDLNGKLVKNIAFNEMPANMHTIDIHTGDLSNGTYLLSVQANNKTLSSTRFIVNK